MSWYIYALLAPAIWAAVNHIDKYIISKYFADVSPALLVLFTSLVAGMSAIVLAFFVPVFAITLSGAIWIIIGGMIFVGSYIPYVYALQSEEASIVAPLFQLIFVFSLLFGFVFLGEHVTGIQLVASILIIMGAIALSLDLDVSVKKLKRTPFLLMIFASFLLGLNMLIFKMVALESSFWVTAFWEYVGAVIFGFMLLGWSRKFRVDFFAILHARKGVIGWNIFNEALNIIARLSASFASLLAPLALVSLANSAQPLFIMVYGFILSFFLKGIQKENFSGKYLWQKIAALVLMVAGGYLLFI